MNDNIRKIIDEKVNPSIERKLEESVERFTESEVGTEQCYLAMSDMKELVELQEDLTKTDKSEEEKPKFDVKAWMPAIVAGIGMVGTVITTTMITRYEDDGNLVTSFASKFIK